MLLLFTIIWSCGGGNPRKPTPSAPDVSASEQSPPIKSVGTSAGGGPGLEAGSDGFGEQSSTGEPEEDWPDWVIRGYFDPELGFSVPIIDGRVIICMKDPAPPLTVDPNYFDDTSVEPDPSIYPEYPPVLDDPRVQQFLAETGAVPYSEWISIRAFGVILPSGMTVEQAVSSWPSAYSSWMDTCEPDYVGRAQDYPNDYYACQPQIASWHLWGSAEGSQYQYGMRVYEAWENGNYGENVIVAVIDTGVQREWGIHYYYGLAQHLTQKGANVGDDAKSTEFAIGGGQGWSWVRDKKEAWAREYGHGSLVAGALAAVVNNDGNSQLGGYNDVAGVGRKTYIFPIAMKMPGGEYSKSTENSAYDVLGAVKGVYNASEIWKKWPWIWQACPRYNIEISNHSYGMYKLNESTKRHLDRLSPYILMVAAAGNDGTTNKLYPAAHSGVLAIAAYDRFGQRVVRPGWWASNYGPWVFAAGPVEFYSTDPIGRSPKGYVYGYTDLFHQTYEFTGTSAAAPAVAGIAALVQGKHLSWTPQDVKSQLSVSIVPLPDRSIPGKIDAVIATR